MHEEERKKWFKNRGYLHLSPKLDLDKKKKVILKWITNPEFVSKYSFFPLIHSTIKERRYKLNKSSGIRSHISSSGKSNAKVRPLHFASHLDSMIFGFYAEKLKTLYEEVLGKDSLTSECIIAYRQIPDLKNPGKNKSTIHFANEAFQEINNQTEKLGECSVLKFDIEKYFSEIDHVLLKASWSELLKEDRLPLDHYKVFKATTDFSYVLKDDLRIFKKGKGRKLGFDEKKIAENRKNGVESFFSNAGEFREAIKSGKLKIYKNPFWSKNEKRRKGIPQGLPISAILANLYLLDFDKRVVEEVVLKRNGCYRRYSDDILIILPKEEQEWANEFINNLILERNVKISKDKTEIFTFKKIFTPKKITIVGELNGTNNKQGQIPLNYLGFDFYGNKTLIASKNLSKFYRRMKTSIKKKINIAYKKFEKDEIHRSGISIYKRQLTKIYTKLNLENSSLIKKRKKLVKNIYGYHVYKISSKEPPFRGNYLTYVKRASELMNEPSIEIQIKNHKKIFNKYIAQRLEIKNHNH
ncbi:reverse transcriptase domain-containing protein [Algoriphagus terrigena]|uniref:reverse transcriptase domain-containing protein n=1 Tax=Algoriphagus terrigena TaxID=344884 RepID=UPI00041D7E99|nr:reverse transcriptase domain-containing protein [Algoriphagus terrigena]